MSRPFALLAIALFNVQPLSANYQGEQSLYSDHNKALYGHSFRNFSRMTRENCLVHCLKDCLCLSFQICNNNNDPQCQLCSSNKYLNPQSLKQSEGCKNYNFGSQDGTEVGSHQKCTQNIPVLNPCLNGGKCVPPMSSDRTRYRCECPAGYKGDHCETMCATSLLIKERSKSNYVIINTGIPKLKAITVSFWIKTTQIGKVVFIMTYAAGTEYNAFRISNPNQLTLTMFNQKTTPDNTLDTQVNDGNWHHVCTTWTSQDGAFVIYKDGIIVGSGTIAMGKKIPSGGAWVLAQDQDKVGGGFNYKQAFQGELAEVHIFDKVLSLEEILEMKKTCAQSMHRGNVISWNDFKSGKRGDVQEVPATCC